MEQETAILIADLSGYTALTETHGAFSAADLVDKYLEITNASLVGDSRLHQAIGDEVFIVSSAPDYLLSTAIMLLHNAVNQPNFLQVHGALHYGKVLVRNGNYFGEAINLTSRMASHAKANTFLCSEEFLSLLSNEHLSKMQSKGKFSFKNVSEEKEVFELLVEKPDYFRIDPICRMIVHLEIDSISHPVEPDLFFCSHQCLKLYQDKNSKNS